MPVVADIDADVGVLCLEDRIAEIAGLEIELLPETWAAVRDVILPVFAEVSSVRIDHGRGVVVDPSPFFLVDRHYDDHRVPLRDFLHQLDRGAIRYPFHRVVPARVLLGAEVRTGEDLLHAYDLYSVAAGLIEQLQVLLDIEIGRASCRERV